MARHPDKHNPELEQLLGPTGYDVGCDECFELLAQYAELEIEGENADERIPGLRNHLDDCPPCQEEHDSLVALVANDKRTTD